MTQPEAPFRHILVATRDADRLAGLLQARHPDRLCRAGSLAALTPADLAWADVLVTPARPLQADLGAVRWVHSPFAGIDALLRGTPWPAGVHLTRTTGAMGRRIAEHVLARALAFCQHLPRLLADQHARRWDPQPARDLYGTRVLVAGTGHVGQAIGALFHAAGCHVEGLSRSGAARAPFARVYPTRVRAEAVQGADWVVLALPLTPHTRHLFDADLLARCRGAVLINIGRGAVVDEQALVQALQTGTLAGAALDVFETEPLPQDAPLWRLPNVLISPHQAALTTPEEAADSFTQACTALEAGHPPPLAVDPHQGY